MSEERLHKILEDLQAELGKTEVLNTADRKLLTGVVDQIHKTLEGSEAPEDEDDSLLAAVDDAALHFESEHPRLTKALYQISEILRSAGLS